LQALRSQFLVKVEDNLGIGMGTKCVALALKPLSEFLEIVNLAIESNPDRIILIGHGLFTRGGEIDNTQTLMTQTNRHVRRVKNQLSFVVRSAMPKGMPHTAEKPRINGLLFREISVDAAHRS
jgi:hypothetical protein